MDPGHLDLVETAMITIGAEGHGEIAFDALQAGLDLGYSQSIVHFTRAGFDEMEDVAGDGHCELLDDAIEIMFAYHNGDEAVLKPNERLLQQPASLTASQIRGLY